MTAATPRTERPAKTYRDSNTREVRDAKRKMRRAAKAACRKAASE